jgi:NAD(P)-dependent dehydrogenase (short-subunit alcohol dehydrogenase family)
MKQVERDSNMSHSIDVPTSEPGRQSPEIVGPLRGQHAVVTGASRGIGVAIAGALARLGANVTLMSRNGAILAARAADLERMFKIRTQAIEIDVADESRVAAAFTAATDNFGTVHILVNNAGIAEAAPFSKTDLAMWQRVIGVDLTGAFLCTRQVLRDMVNAGQGRVVNVASTAGLTGYPYVAAYCAAKHGVIGLTRALAREVARTGVTVNAVCPGYTDTEIVATTLTNIVAKTGRSREQALADIVAHNPQGRLITPEEVADAVAWLCLPSSASITGQSILVAGGELM